MKHTEILVHDSLILPIIVSTRLCLEIIQNCKIYPLWVVLFLAHFGSLICLTFKGKFILLFKTNLEKNICSEIIGNFITS